MRLPVVLLALIVPLAATAMEKLTGEQINRAFTGNTVSGRYTGGGFFTEYHDPDGRALGNNGWQENRDACWITKGDAVCYYYGPPEERTTHCFTVELTDRLYILRNVGDGRINAIATVESANPRNHTDGGKPWYCDGLISRGPQAPLMSRRVAAR
ncbi:hypothetical protein [Bosea sp. (in: a-proteobacteria)]|uniref:hypothetical protein n=1 Tax=Bosea sp. (in: a-proteobacteria) TaxID=1871050 RepID=UPI001D9F5F4D|nr:hypothetical protein [Bosea sp. (in: a-proteobacteria)]MBA4219172.1 hypothetical protein [Methylobacterium sp.]MBR3194919.1 hypothetical protein [Bosea sp. (in: a-proteobacteria)]